MHVVHALNVNDAWPALIELVKREGKWVDTRAGRALVVPVPVATVYSHPTERVLFDPVRDANPFFSLFEPLWMLAGRDDADWLDVFIPSFSERFAEEGGRMHGAYGKRWRDWFQREDTTSTSGNGDQVFYKIDQLDECVRLLTENPLDRQAVIQMWDPSADLGFPGLKDRPCNQQILLRADRVETMYSVTDPGYGKERRYLDVTVTNRSNDLSWGLITANACQFSTLQEYLAARMGYEVGTYTQFSNNLHLYESAMDKVDYDSAYSMISVDEFGNNLYPTPAKLVDDPSTFDEELRAFLAEPGNPQSRDFSNRYFYDVARPMWIANEYRRQKLWMGAFDVAEEIAAPDWRAVTTAWIQRRMK